MPQNGDVEDEQSEATGSGHWAIDALSRRLAGLDVFEGVGLVALLALSLRIVASLVAGIVTLVQQSGYDDVKQEISNALTWFGSFGELTQAILPLGLLAFLWWRVGRWVDILDEVEGEPDPGDDRKDAKRHIATLRWESAWVRWILLLTVIAALLAVVPGYLYLPSDGEVWKQLMVSTSFQVADVAILVGGAVLAYRLRETCDLDSDNVEVEP